jgi:hypothetical protein
MTCPICKTAGCYGVYSHPGHVMTYPSYRIMDKTETEDTMTKFAQMGKDLRDCPNCGSHTLLQTARADYCFDCGYSERY